MFSRFLYPTGFVLLALATAALVAAVVNPASRLGRALGWTPLRWTGVRSYGIYLWQWPIIVLASPTVITFQWRRAALEVAGTLLVAGLSWRFVEDPIRRGALGRMWRRARDRKAPPGPGPDGAHGGPVRRRAGCAARWSWSASAGRSPVASAGPGSAPAGGRLARVQALTDHRRPSPASIRPGPGGPARAGADTIVVSSGRLHRRLDLRGRDLDRLHPQPVASAWRRSWLESGSGRCIRRSRAPARSSRRSRAIPTRPRSRTTTSPRAIAGAGSWPWAPTTSTTSTPGPRSASSARINHMMAIIGRPPGPVGGRGHAAALRPLLRARHAALEPRAARAACKRHPTMRVFDWPAWAKPRWFIPDGIHYYSPGLRGPDPPHLAGAGPRVPGGRALQRRLPCPLTRSDLPAARGAS